MVLSPQYLSIVYIYIALVSFVRVEQLIPSIQSFAGMFNLPHAAPNACRSLLWQPRHRRSERPGLLRSPSTDSGKRGPKPETFRVAWTRGTYHDAQVGGETAQFMIGQIFEVEQSIHLYRKEEQS